MQHKKKAVVVFSGGMDSITLLHFVKAKLDHDLVWGISFYYGQRHEKELEFAQYWGKILCHDWQKVDISFMKSIAANSALLNPKLSIPQDHYTNENQKITVVANRNMVMLSIAVAWAENLEIPVVFFGAHANDYAIYPDCRREFVEMLSHASTLATYSHVKIEAPFVNIQKWQIAQIGKELGVDYSKTWSCYQGRSRHCGKCGTCQERKEAFLKANLLDPTDYEK